MAGHEKADGHGCGRGGDDDVFIIGRRLGEEVMGCMLGAEEGED